MPCTPLVDRRGKRVGILCTSSEYVYKGVRFTFSPDLGPWFCNKKGDEVQPTKRHWNAFGEWLEKQKEVK